MASGLLYTVSCSAAYAQTDLKQAVSALSNVLSHEATITFPGGANWDSLQLRSSSPRISPHYSVVVQVATESDVQATVTLANRFNIPFLAVAGGHGWTTSLNNLPYGIQINMRKLNTTTLGQGGKTAIVGGGALQYEATRALFAKGKYAVTGLCECTSVVGPLLGGGHSVLQGQHGYSLDGLVSARVVTATGKLVEASRTKNADLFWALQGAGHNFGILTSFEVKAYDVPSTWTIYSLVFSNDKLESLFKLINEFEGPSIKRSAKLVLTGAFAKIPAVDPVNPVIAYSIAYEGPQAEAEQYAARFTALGPLSTTLSTNIAYPDIYKVLGSDINNHVCSKNGRLTGGGLTLPAWDLPGVRKAFSIFTNVTADPRFATSALLIENYGMQGVRAVDPASTALALEERRHPILTSAGLWWTAEGEQATQDAYAYVRAIRDALAMGVDKSGEKRHCYVNYANGEESKPELYGYDDRLARLTRLKREWDPKNSFRYYNPIV
ncbi:6-hydroxy-D-nicotine oxidase [Pyrenophora seminiperda CCB06]|uniref:6-hydroxy-D-nicotine oxidase n=1 Tax=Pyrenophora seminiperda CCB06 TaxID=1302712 RepID=A0A3M7MH35_9PLEO|nr:6-hydroxy-D-nicotine oxidase [Pyrenophora seminiperda CCB06]